jgi:hypothetical protein
METAAAILVQTILDSDDRLKTLLRGETVKGPVAAAEFLTPFYVAALTAIKRAHKANPEMR